MKRMSLTQWLKWIVGMDYQAIPVPVRNLKPNQRLSFEPLADRRLPSITPWFFNMEMSAPPTSREALSSEDGFAPRGFGFGFGFGSMDAMRGMGMMFSFCPMHTMNFGADDWLGGSPWAPPAEEELATDATHFDVKLISDAYSGETTKIAVVALDEFNQPVPGYTGTIQFTSTDPSAVLPDDYTFTDADRGVHVFEITAANVGDLTITVTEATTDETTDEPTDDVSDEVVSDPTDVIDEPIDDVVDEVIDETTEEVVEEPTLEEPTLEEPTLEEPTDDTTTVVDEAAKSDDATATEEVKDELLTDGTDIADVTDITEEPTAEVVDETTEEHTDDHDHSTDDTTADVIDESTDEVVDETVEEPVDEVVEEPTDEVVDDVTDVVDESTGGIVDDVIDDVVEEPTDEIVDEVIEEPTDEIVDEVIDEPTDEVVDEVIDTPTEDVVDTTPAMGTITFSVTAAPVATHFEIRAFRNVLADEPTRFMIVALDATNRPVTNYNGTIHVSSTDATATLPADFTFTDADQGTHVFVGEFDTTGTQTLTVNDATNSSLTGAVALNVLDSSASLWALPSFGFWGPRRLGLGA